MEENQLTAKESLEIIQKIVDQSKEKYEERGLTILVWGFLVFAAGLSQFIMIKIGNGDKSYLPWVVTMIPGFLITFIAKFIEGAKSSNKKGSSDRMGFVWLLAGTMAMITGFILSPRNGGLFMTTLIWGPFCVAAFATALYLREKVFIFMSILASILAYGATFVPGIYHPVLTSLIALVLMIIPGIKLYIDHKVRNRV